MTSEPRAGADDEGHGVHGAAREDGRPQEEPEPSGDVDEGALVDATDTGAEAAS